MNNPEPTIPEGGEYLWQLFWRISNRRLSNQSGPQPISFSEMQAFSACTGVNLEPFETDAVIAMDDSYRAHLNREMKAIRDRKTLEDKRRSQKRSYQS